MKIKKAEYFQGAVKKSQYPQEKYPEIALVGRSNVGKSSLLNKLVNRKKLAHTSSEPGKTKIINFYLINNSFMLVDLPGYGFAKVSAQMREQWRGMVEEYLRERRT
ncbi:MAG TPA: ribosome biogenesis GTP-binding protein YsxC, partial [Firmicutes bacterium]|nr:ribosome biogenesis GTP-binding protein YsxC [Bacillota bacterium]